MSIFLPSRHSELCLRAFGPLALPTGNGRLRPGALGSTILPVLPGGLPSRLRAAGLADRGNGGASVDVEIVELEVHLELFLGRFVKLSCVELLEWA